VDVGESKDRSSITNSVHTFHLPGLPSAADILSQVLVGGKPNSPYRVVAQIIQSGISTDVQTLEGLTNDDGVAGGRVEGIIP
jgi:hypothetical protein